MASLICGSVAYDTIMNFEGRFQEQILPDQIHILNVAFLVPKMRREFGGCAGNIAYNLKLLGGEPIIMAAVGGDAKPYLERFSALQIDVSHIRQMPTAFTAQAMITTDLANNQITAFHPGAMNDSHLNTVAQVLEQRRQVQKPLPTLGIVAPDGRQGMWEHCHQLAEAQIPFIFDPGQGLPMFDGKELLELSALASYLAVNDYEGEMLALRTGMPLKQLAGRVKALIVTKGAAGATIYTNGKEITIPVVNAAHLIDPTGCGDAFRAGLLYGLNQSMDWETTGKLASLMGSIKITHQGPQNHQQNAAEIADLFAQAFGYRY
ncbi:RbsK Sugar kinases, ribokinase family [Burkholderiaceae bacterium]|jgi:adenosine kinase